MNVIKGSFFRAPYQREPLHERASDKPYFDLAEHDATAEAYARWYNAFVAAHHRRPTQAETAKADLPGIRRMVWRIVLFNHYCREAGMI